MYKKIFGIASIITFINIFPAFATDKYIVDGDNYNHRFTVYNQGEKLVIGDESKESPFSIEKKYLSTANMSAQKWATVIETAQTPKPIAEYTILSEDEYNASATSPYVKIAESPYRVTLINAIINNRQITEEDEDDDDDNDVHGLIFIGHGIDPNNPGWQEFSGFHSLYRGYKLPDFHAVILHEMMHALGLVSDVSKQREETDKDGYYFTEKDSDSLTILDKDLRIYTGNDPKIFDSAYEIVPNATMKVDKKETFDIFKYSPYYVGKTTLQVLSGKDNYEDARAAIIKNGGMTNYSISYDGARIYPRVYGLPIHNADDNDIDLSHIELHNSFMSHQSFRNWLIPMEAELAVLNDMGYTVDLRKFFGKSYYLDNQTEKFATGYAEWDGVSYTNNPSTIKQGVGLHIYGNNNNITQTSDILSVGEGAFGVRIDGVGNKYFLSGGSHIEANGTENLGIAVTWGENHTINIEKNSSVTANGEKGIALAFDFGDNLFGNLSDARGSYINYSGDNDMNLNSGNEHDEALVKQLNIAGTITGSKAAVYIADNAHVAQINILNGARINGDIISEWNSLQSGPNAKVQWEYGSLGWDDLDEEITSQLYYTDLNIDAEFDGTINGSIDGETKFNNTIKLNNAGNPDIKGDKIYVYSLDNTGHIQLDSVSISVEKGIITGNGDLNIADSLELSDNIEKIENTINLASNALLSTLNEVVNTLEIDSLNTDSAYISFDLGDKYILQNTPLNNTAQIAQIKLNDETAAILHDDMTYVLFNSEKNILDLGNSHANIYYNGQKYHVSQDIEHKNLLHVKIADKDAYLPDAVIDETTANYIVKEDKQKEDIGIVRGDDFEISGKDINVSGYKGLVIDKRFNKNGTVLKTGIFGAKDNNISVINSGTLKVIADDKDIVLGRKDENAIYLKNAQAVLDAKNHTINVEGTIKGSSASANIITASGNAISFQKVDNTTIALQNTEATINNVSQNTIWEINNSKLTIKDDKFLSADGSNSIMANNSTVDLLNGTTSPINLKEMALTGIMALDLDVDLATLSADRFIIVDENISVADAVLKINRINLINQNSAITAEKIKIPFINGAAQDDTLFKNVSITANSEILTPIFKYNLDYYQDNKSGNFILRRGAVEKYASYNPAIMTAPIAALSGGYLSQLKSYDKVFSNIGKTLQTANNFSEQTIIFPDKTLWIRPSSSFEKTELKNGPRVSNNLYDVYAGIDSKTLKIFNNWDFQYGVYGGYNQSRQKYSANTIHQKGGTVGIVSYLSKGDFHNISTINIGADRAEASTLYGKENFYLLRYGIADKIGFNWYPYKENFVIEPNFLTSYTFVKTTNYHNAAHVSINSHPLHALSIAPGVMIAYNLPNGWNPYTQAKMVWNFMNNTKFKAQHTNIPEMSVKPYTQYGFGLQKIWNEKISGYGQLDFFGGSRHGFELTAGIKWNFE